MFTKKRKKENEEEEEEDREKEKARYEATLCIETFKLNSNDLP